jgi:hypothetical protein
MPKPSPNISLKPDEILIAEYNYIAQSAFQANEDRARVASFYFVSVGSLVAAILSTQFAGDIQGIAPAFSLLFAFLTLLGTLTISQLARLRAAWYAAVLAMNKIKDYTIEHFPHLDPAFASAILMIVSVVLLVTEWRISMYHTYSLSADTTWWMRRVNFRCVQVAHFSES